MNDPNVKSINIKKMTQIIITKVIDRFKTTALINKIEKCGLIEARGRVDDINKGVKLLMDVPNKYLDKVKKACEFKIIPQKIMEKNQFKPFDKVLVRDYDDDPWRTMYYSHFDEQQRHVCISSYWKQCIPYNENTAHLIGTNQPYKEPEPKVWKVISGNYNNTLTSEELSNFIKTAVINNKDVLDLRIVHVDK